MSHEILKETMTLLVKILREILTNMEEEQHIMLMQDNLVGMRIINQRSVLMTAMHDCRNTLTKELEKLKVIHDDEENELEILKNLAHMIGEDKIDLLILRDQILALTEKVEQQYGRNGYPTGENIKETEARHYKSLKRRIYPKKHPVQKKKILVKTLELATED